MKNLADKFLSEQAHQQINEAVQAAEKNTSGEIVCMVQSASYHYPMANVIGATAIALPICLVLTPVLGGWLWLGPQNMWLFLSLFAVCFPVCYLMVNFSVRLKRLFISQREIDEEVQESAITSFFQHGLYRTREANGVLLFISVFEHKVWVLADHGIHAKIPQDQWQAIVDTVTEGFKKSRPGESICQAVQTIGRQLESHFPVQADDIDELDNVIIAKD